MTREVGETLVFVECLSFYFHLSNLSGHLRVFVGQKVMVCQEIFSGGVFRHDNGSVDCVLRLVPSFLRYLDSPPFCTACSASGSCHVDVGWVDLAPVDIVSLAWRARADDMVEVEFGDLFKFNRVVVVVFEIDLQVAWLRVRVIVTV